jgi:hypothetical protein
MVSIKVIQLIVYFRVHQVVRQCEVDCADANALALIIISDSKIMILRSLHETNDPENS